MAKITYIEPGGAERTVEVADGYSVMQGAINNGIDGILATCGGACACATCHVYVMDAWVGTLPARSDMETDMLEFAIDPGVNSRLSCQIAVTDLLDGLVVRIPLTQG